MNHLTNQPILQLTNNDLELIRITGSLRGRAKSSRPRRQGQNCRRRSQSYIEDDFDPTTPASCFAAGRSRAGYWDTLLNMQNEPNLQNTQINVSSFTAVNCDNFYSLECPKNEPNTNPILSTIALAKPDSWLFFSACLACSAVRNRVNQQNKKMQNEPNLPNAQINVTTVPVETYMKNDAFALPKNEPKTNPIYGK